MVHRYGIGNTLLYGLKRAGSAYKVKNPEVDRISIVDPVVQYIPYHGLIHRKPAHVTKEEWAKVMKNAGFTYQYETRISPSPSYNTLERVLDTLPSSKSHSTLLPNQRALHLLGELHHQTGPAIVRADGAVGTLLAQQGKFPTFLHGDDNLFFYGPATYTAVSADGAFSGPSKLAFNARVAEGEILIGLAASLAAELYCSDAQLRENETGAVLYTINNIGKAMDDWYPISIFSPQGEKLRSPVMDAVNEDSYLF
jgi:hypothetical protein